MTHTSSFLASEDNFVDEEGDVDMELLESDNENDDQDDLIEESPNEIPEIPTTNITNITNEERTVPVGWTCKGQGSHMTVTSPTGGAFKSRRSAFVHMVNSGQYSVKEINEMNVQ